MASEQAIPHPNWLRLAVGGGAALFVGMGLGRFSYSAMIPALIADGGLTPAQAGYVAAFNLAGFLLGVLVQPRLRAIAGERGTLQLSLIVALVCLIASIGVIPAPWAFHWLAFWRGLVGIAVGVIMVQALAVVTRAAPRGKLGLASGIVFTGVGGGILLSGLAIPRLLTFDLTSAWSGVAVIGAVAVGVGFWGLAAPIPDAGTKPDTSTDDSRKSDRKAARYLVAAQTLFVVGLIPHTIFWVDYLVRGLAHDMAFGGYHWALFGLGALTGTALWGWLADRIGFRAGLVLVFLSLAVGSVLPVLETAGWALVFSSLVVGAQPGCSALLSARTQQIFGNQAMPKIWRRMTLVGGIGQGIGGYLLVALFDATGSYTAVFMVGGAAMAAGAVISVCLKPN